MLAADESSATSCLFFVFAKKKYKNKCAQRARKGTVKVLWTQGKHKKRVTICNLDVRFICESLELYFMI